MKYGVSPNTLLITAGTIWSLAGVNILRIGTTCWIDDGHYWLFKVCEASLVFLLFFGIIFHRLYKKHTLRISQKKGSTAPFPFRRKRMDCHDRHDCNGNCNTYLPPSARLLHRSVLYRTFSRASRHRATLHLVLVEEQITPDSPIPILCRLRQSADRLALYPSRLIAIPGNFQAMLWPLALILIGIFFLRHHHRRNWTHQRTVHRCAKMVQRMMNKRMGEQEEHSTRRNLHRPGLQLGRSGTAHTRRLASTHRMQLLLRRM